MADHDGGGGLLGAFVRRASAWLLDTTLDTASIAALVATAATSPWHMGSVAACLSDYVAARGSAPASRDLRERSVRWFAHATVVEKPALAALAVSVLGMHQVPHLCRFIDRVHNERRPGQNNNADTSDDDVGRWPILNSVWQMAFVYRVPLTLLRGRVADGSPAVMRVPKFDLDVHVEILASMVLTFFVPAVWAVGAASAVIAPWRIPSLVRSLFAWSDDKVGGYDRVGGRLHLSTLWMRACGMHLFLALADWLAMPATLAVWATRYRSVLLAHDLGALPDSDDGGDGDGGDGDSNANNNDRIRRGISRVLAIKRCVLLHGLGVCVDAFHLAMATAAAVSLIRAVPVLRGFLGAYRFTSGGEAFTTRRMQITLFRQVCRSELRCALRDVACAPLAVVVLASVHAVPAWLGALLRSPRAPTGRPLLSIVSARLELPPRGIVFHLVLRAADDDDGAGGTSDESETKPSSHLQRLVEGQAAGVDPQCLHRPYVWLSGGPAFWRVFSDSVGSAAALVVRALMPRSLVPTHVLPIDGLGRVSLLRLAAGAEAEVTLKFGRSQPLLARHVVTGHLSGIASRGDPLFGIVVSAGTGPLDPVLFDMQLRASEMLAAHGRADTGGVLRPVVAARGGAGNDAENEGGGEEEEEEEEEQGSIFDRFHEATVSQFLRVATDGVALLGLVAVHAVFPWRIRSLWRRAAEDDAECPVERRALSSFRRASSRLDGLCAGLDRSARVARNAAVKGTAGTMLRVRNNIENNDVDDDAIADDELSPAGVDHVTLEPRVAGPLKRLTAALLRGLDTCGERTLAGLTARLIACNDDLVVAQTEAANLDRCAAAEALAEARGLSGTESRPRRPELIDSTAFWSSISTSRAALQARTMTAVTNAMRSRARELGERIDKAPRRSLPPWDAVRAAVAYAAAQAVIDIAAVACGLLAVATMYRFPSLVCDLFSVICGGTKAGRHDAPRTVRSAAFRAAREIAVDAAHVALAAPVLVTGLFAVDMMMAVGDALLSGAGSVRARIAVRYYASRLWRAVISSLRLLLAWDTYRFLVSTTVFAFAAPVDVVSRGAHAIIGGMMAFRTPTGKHGSGSGSGSASSFDPPKRTIALAAVLVAAQIVSWSQLPSPAAPLVDATWPRGAPFFAATTITAAVLFLSAIAAAAAGDGPIGGDLDTRPGAVHTRATALGVVSVLRFAIEAAHWALLTGCLFDVRAFIFPLPLSSNINIQAALPHLFDLRNMDAVLGRDPGSVAVGLSIAAVGVLALPVVVETLLGHRPRGHFARRSAALSAVRVVLCAALGPVLCAGLVRAHFDAVASAVSVSSGGNVSGARLTRWGPAVLLAVLAPLVPSSEASSHAAIATAARVAASIGAAADGAVFSPRVAVALACVGSAAVRVWDVAARRRARSFGPDGSATRRPKAMSMSVFPASRWVPWGAMSLCAIAGAGSRFFAVSVAPSSSHGALWTGTAALIVIVEVTRLVTRDAADPHPTFVGEVHTAARVLLRKEARLPRDDVDDGFTFRTCFAWRDAVTEASRDLDVISLRRCLLALERAALAAPCGTGWRGRGRWVHNVSARAGARQLPTMTASMLQYETATRASFGDGYRVAVLAGGSQRTPCLLGGGSLSLSWPNPAQPGGDTSIYFGPVKCPPGGEALNRVTFTCRVATAIAGEDGDAVAHVATTGDGRDTPLAISLSLLRLDALGRAVTSIEPPCFAEGAHVARVGDNRNPAGTRQGPRLPGGDFEMRDQGDVLVPPGLLIGLDNNNNDTSNNDIGDDVVRAIWRARSSLRSGESAGVIRASFDDVCGGDSGGGGAFVVRVRFTTGGKFEVGGGRPMAVAIKDACVREQ